MNRSILIAAALGTLLCAASAAAAAAPNMQNMAPRKNVAVLVFDGAEVIDYAGPYEVFGDDDRFNVYTVAASRNAVVTGAGLSVMPTYAFANAPAADVLIIPGGHIPDVVHDQHVLDWIKAQAANAQITMSVCNGAFILANTGLLDGLEATTTRANMDKLQAAHPQIKIVRDRRFVDNGRIITTGGLTAGIDGALHIVERLVGKGSAEANALYLEYDAKSDGSYLPGTFAVNVIPDVGPQLAPLGQWDLLGTDGDRNTWKISARVHSDMDGAELMRRVESIYATAGSWVKASPQLRHDNGEFESAWTFERSGRRWRAALSLKPGQLHEYEFSVAVRESAKA